MSNKKRRKSYYGNQRVIAIDAARDDAGQVICDHCKSGIGEEQIISVDHHIVSVLEAEQLPPRAVWKKLGLHESYWQRYEAMTHDEQQVELEHWVNDASNLRPLHYLCHREADDGYVIPDVDRKRFNLKPEWAEAYQRELPANELMSVIKSPVTHKTLTKYLEHAPLNVLEDCAKRVSNESVILQVEAQLTPQKAARGKLLIQCKELNDRRTMLDRILDERSKSEARGR